MTLNEVRTKYLESFKARERIRQIEAKALEKIREHRHAKALEGFENLT